MMNPFPAHSWIDILKAYFRLSFFLLVIFMVPYALTGQYFAGVLVAVVILYLAYRLFFVCEDLTFTPGISRPAGSLAVVFGILVLVAVLGLFIHWQPLRVPGDRELIRHGLTLGIPLGIGIVGYFRTRPRT